MWLINYKAQMEPLYYYWITVLQDGDLQLSIQMMFSEGWMCYATVLMAVQQAYALECACSNLHGSRWQEPCNNFWVLLTEPISGLAQKLTFRKTVFEKSVNILFGIMSCCIARKKDIRSFEVWLDVLCPRVGTLFQLQIYIKGFFSFLTTFRISAL